MGELEKKEKEKEEAEDIMWEKNITKEGIIKIIYFPSKSYITSSG